MPISLDNELLDRITYLTGSSDILKNLTSVASLEPFCDEVLDFLNEVSKKLMRDTAAREYSDVVTFAFWIRKGSVEKLREKFKRESSGIQLGKGIVFHIAPSNVPVNFAYSLVSGLLTGNANIVRVPSKDFPQVRIITEAFNEVIKLHKKMEDYVICIRYERDEDINSYLSSVAEMRVIWGGDRTIAELRRSSLPPRSGEITFADRYSLAVIDSDSYLAMSDKKKVAEDFYNDTFFSDQNACTSPRIIIWTGDKICEAKETFWKLEHELVSQKYIFQDIQGVNKLTSAYLIAAAEPGIKVEPHNDNLIIRVSVPEITDRLMDYRDNSGYFYEYECRNIMDIVPLCNDKKCQTIGYIGNADVFTPIIRSGVKGIDRIVPIGHTMDFDLIWDGYNLPSMLTRSVSII